MQLKRGARIRFSETKRRQIVFEVHIILGVIWDDELDKYFVLIWMDGDEEPETERLKDCQLPIKCILK